MPESGREESELQRTCYECGAPASALYEGCLPPDGPTVRKATCSEHEFEGMKPLRRMARGY